MALNRLKPLSNILDLGTVSGCLAITLAYHLSHAKLLASDLSEAALEVAKANLERYQLANCQLLKSDLFSNLGQAKFDLIVTNPPYIAHREISQLAPEVRDYDPKIALDGGKKGLDYYHKIADHARNYLYPNGQIICEIGIGQKTDIVAIFEAHNFHLQKILRDLSGIERVLSFKIA